MCSVVGYIGKNLSNTFVFEGLARLEYRGYDSAGFACLDMSRQQLLCVKASGQLSHLIQRITENPIDGFVGIGHTRWSTHGDFSEKNAHPHFDCKKTISVVHNGIIENHDELRTRLQAEGHIFESSTDTEVITHLFESLLASTCSLELAVIALVESLRGMYAFVIMMRDYPDMLLAVRKQSPLCVGFGDNEMFVASDVIAFAGKADSVFFLPDESFSFIYRDSIELYDFSGALLPVKPQPLLTAFLQTDKGSYEHFMLKEIEEQPAAIKTTVEALASLGDGLWNQLGITKDQVHNIKRIVLIGCGTSWHAARIAHFFFEMICKIPVDVLLASECRYMPFFPDKNALYVFISQSGETADTLEALRLINSYNLSTIALTNVVSSTIVRQAGGFILTHAGVEVSVASTKAFSTQLTVLYWLACRIAAEVHGSVRRSFSEGGCGMQQAEEDLLFAAKLLGSTLDRYRYAIELSIAPRYAMDEKAIFLGKHISYPFAMESALKLKEIGYVFANCYSSGELKHGPLALIDHNIPVYIFSHNDSLIYQKLLSNAHAVHSRGGRIIAFAYEGQGELCSLAETYFIISADIPPLLGPLAMTGLMQYLMYSIAKFRGCPIDKPRNLAKSVTVE